MSINKIISFLYVCLLCCFLFGCGGQASGEDSEKAAAMAFAEEYLRVFQKEGPERAVSYCQFEPSEAYTAEDFYTLYVRSGTIIDDYKIKNFDRINDNLYAVTLEIKEGNKGWSQIYNFVGKIDGDYQYMNSTGHIPETLRENLDVDAYRYTDSNVFYPSEVDPPREGNG